MGQANCLQSSDKNNNQKQSQLLSPQDLKEENDFKKEKLVLQIYKQLFKNLLPILEQLLQKLTFHLLSNDEIQNNLVINQPQNNNQLDQSIMFKIKKQEEEWYSEVLAHRAKKESQIKQNMLDNQYMSNEQFFQQVLIEMLKQINQLDKVVEEELNYKQIRSFIRNMEEILYQFLQIQKKQKSSHHYRNYEDNQDDGNHDGSRSYNNLNPTDSLDETCDESQESKYKDRQMDKKFLQKYLNHEYQQKWFTITQKIENILPNQKHVDLKLKYQEPQTRDGSFIIKSEAQQSIISGLKKLMIINTATRIEKKVEKYSKCFPYSYKDIINVHQIRKQILYYNRDSSPENDSLLNYINYKKIRGEGNLQEKIKQFKLHLKLLHQPDIQPQNHQNTQESNSLQTIAFNIYEPLNIIKIKNTSNVKFSNQIILLIQEPKEGFQALIYTQMKLPTGFIFIL